MLINVFGKWINPERIEYLKDCTNYQNSPNQCYITAIMYNGCYVEIYHKTGVEVAAEINKQLKEAE
jgi:hypothetical protein